MKLFSFIMLCFFSVSSFAGMFIGLDVRSDYEVKENPAPKSIHITMGDLKEKAPKLLDKNKEIFVFCESGGRAKQAVKILKEMGYARVENIGSWRDWNKIKNAK